MNANRYELARLGVGPFRVAAVVELPSSSLGEQNPDGYNARMREAQEQARHYGVSLGTCYYCGQALRANVVVGDSLGAFFVLGTECATKIGGQTLGDAAAIAVAVERRECAREERRRQRVRRQQLKLDVRDPATGETRREFLMRQQREDAGLDVQLMLARRSWVERLRPFAAQLADGNGRFRDSIAEGLLQGKLPRGKGVEIALDIYAKSEGRRNSQAYYAAWNAFASAMGLPEYAV